MDTSHERTPLQRAAQAVLRERGAMPLDDLAARLQADGFDLGDDPEDFLDEALLDCDDLDELPDGRQLDIATAIEGAVATSRPAGGELAAGVVQLEPDLELLLLPDGDQFALSGGGVAGIELSERDEDAGDHGVWLLSGPPGWLDHLQAGELAAFRIAGGALHVEPAPEVADPEQAAAALGAVFGEQSPDGEPIETRQLLLAALIDHAGVLREPRHPLTELLAAAGLETYGDWVGEQGTDWGPDPDAHYSYLDAESREALELVLSGFQFSLAEGPEELAAHDDVVDALAACLSMEGVAEAFVAEVLGVGTDVERIEMAAATAGWATVVADGAPSYPGPHYVRATCSERIGETESSEHALHDALRVDPGFRPALLDAAWYAEDRGDAARALSALRRAGVDDDDPQLTRLERYAAPGPAAAGRNEPCPCGSGRKYKVCCAKRNGHPLQERAFWVLAKASEFAQRPGQRDVIAELAITRTGGDPDDPAWVDAALRDPVVTDLALFEEGLLEQFCDDRGPLLPADELELARSWIGLPLGLYEVTAVREGIGMELRDLATGARLDVTERLGSTDLSTGALLFARVLPVADTYRLSPFGVRVPFTLRDRLLAFLDTDPDGWEIAGWFAAAEAPPQLQTTDGEPLVQCTATFGVDDPNAAADALDGILEGGDGRWEEFKERDGDRVLLGAVTLDEATLTVQTNSEARFDALLDKVDRGVPGLELEHEERVPAAELLARTQAEPATDVPEFDDEGVAEALSAYMEQMERRWVDEPVPALGGLTPRKAADDPTRRGDLERLLAQFEASHADAPAGMASFDVGRLRRLLGIG